MRSTNGEVEYVAELAIENKSIPRKLEEGSVTMKVPRLFVAMIAAAVMSMGAIAVTAPAADAAAKSTATTKEYRRIKDGQSLKKVRRIIGGKGENVTTGAPPSGEYVYMWRSTKGRDLYVKFIDSNVSAKKRIKDKTLSSTEKKKTRSGQSFGKIKKIARADRAGGEGDGDVYYGAWCAANGRDYWLGYFDADTNKLVGKFDSVSWLAAEPWWGPCPSIGY